MAASSEAPALGTGNIPLLTADMLRAAGRRPPEPFRIALADGRQLTVVRLLRVLPGKRLVGEGDLAGRRVLAKLFIGPRGEAHCRRERRGIEALLAAGVPTPPLLATSAMVGGGHALLTSFLDTAENLAAAWAPFAAAPVGDAAAVSLLAPALTLLGRLHAAGLAHDDLHFGNFLYDGDGVLLVDGDAVRTISPGRPLSATAACANLAVFLAQLPLSWDVLPASLLDAYDEGDEGAGRPAPDPARLRQRIAAVRAWRLADFLRKTVRDCTLFAVEHTFTRFSAVVRHEARNLAPLIAAPKAFVDEACRLPATARCVVNVAVAERVLTVTRYPVADFSHSLSRLGRSSDAWRGWREGHRLRFLGIATPAPLAMIEERVGPLRRRAWLINDHCAGTTLGDHLLADREPPLAVARALLALIDDLRRQRISHGRLSATSLLWSAGRLMLTDLETARQHRLPATHARAWRDDRARLLRDWPAGSTLHRWLDAHLPPG
jgi:hypothetical protein